MITQVPSLVGRRDKDETAADADTATRSEYLKTSSGLETFSATSGRTGSRPSWGQGSSRSRRRRCPFRVPGLHVFALVVWVLAAAWLVALSAAWAVALDEAHGPRSRAREQPGDGQFWGAPAMALLTVGAGTLLVGRDLTGAAAAVDIDWVLWFLGTALGLVTACWIPYLMMTRHEIKPDGAFGGWLMADRAAHGVRRPRLHCLSPTPRPGRRG